MSNTQRIQRKILRIIVTIRDVKRLWVAPFRVFIRKVCPNGGGFGQVVSSDYSQSTAVIAFCSLNHRSCSLVIGFFVDKIPKIWLNLPTVIQLGWKITPNLILCPRFIAMHVPSSVGIKHEFGRKLIVHFVFKAMLTFPFFAIFYFFIILHYHTKCNI